LLFVGSLHGTQAPTNEPATYWTAFCKFCLEALDAPYGLIALIDYEKEVLDIGSKTETGRFAAKDAKNCAHGTGLQKIAFSPQSTQRTPSIK
jgi:hypothetical protein